MNIIIDIQYKSGSKDTCYIWFAKEKNDCIKCALMCNFSSPCMPCEIMK